MLRCRDLAAIVEAGPDPASLTIGRPCRDRVCCPRREGYVAVHRWPLTLTGDGLLVVGEMATRYEPIKRAQDLAR